MLGNINSGGAMGKIGDLVDVLKGVRLGELVLLFTLIFKFLTPALYKLPPGYT